MRKVFLLLSLIPVGGGKSRVIVKPERGAEEAAAGAWSPDGRRVAYHSRRSGEWGVWVMAAR
jgi:Tol biopolymer transport system component